MRQSLLIVLLLVFSAYSYAQTTAWVVKPQYDAIADFSDSIAAVKQNGKWGYVSRQGKVIVPCEYEIAYPYSDGMGILTMSDNTLAAISDLNGNIIPITTKLKIDNRFAGFSNGLLLVTDGRKWGYLNKSGKLSIECKYLFALPFSEGLAGVRLDYNGDWYYIAANGSTMIYPGFQGGKKEVYWALGFNNGKALIVYRNGLGYINNTGKELSEKTPKFSPPDDPASYKRNILQGKEGYLAFDSKGRILSFTANNGDAINFIPVREKTTPNTLFILNGATVKDNLKWQADNSAIVGVAGKYGIVEIHSESPVTISSSNNLLESIFGNPVTFSYAIQNNSDQDIESLKLMVNDAVIAENIPIPKKQQKELTIQIEKQKDSAEESGTLKMTVEELGLLLGSYEFNYKIVDKPSITVLIPIRNFEVNESGKTYPLKVVVRNNSNVEAKNIKIMVNSQSQEISMHGMSEATLIFNTPVKETNINITAKPQKTPPVLFTGKTTVNVKNEAVRPSDTPRGISNVETLGETKK